MIDFECLWKKTPFCHKLFSSDKFGRPIKTLWKYLLVLPLCISKEIPLRLRSVRTIGRDLTISKSAYKPQAVLGSLPTHPILSLITCYPSPPERGHLNTSYQQGIWIFGVRAQEEITYSLWPDLVWVENFSKKKYIFTFISFHNWIIG
jgi:hypothetical protein